MKKHLLIIVLFTLLVSSLCCLAENTNTQTADGQTVTLLDYFYSGSEVTATFRIDNNSGKELALSALLDWEAKDASGKKLDVDWLTSDLGGTLLDDDFIKGNVCFKGVTQQPVKVQYSTALWGGTTLSFTLGKEDSTLSSVKQSLPSGKETKQADGQTVTLLSISYSGDKVTGTFRIDNNSGDEVTLSSMLDWEAKDASGKKLDIDWMASNMEGKLIDGDFIKGDVVFKGVTEKPVRFYYTTSWLFGTTLMFKGE